MAKKPGEAFAMSDEDEFVETDGEGGGDGSDENSNTGSESGESGDGSDSGAEGEGNAGEGDGGSSESSDDNLGEGEGEGEEKSGEGSSEAENEGEDGAGEGESNSEGSKESNETGEGEGEGGEGEGGEDEDFFADLSTEADEGGEGEKSPAISFKKLSSALDIELEKDTEEEFAQKIKDKIEAARQEVNLDEFDPEAKRLVKHLNDNGGKIGDFFVNPKITVFQSVLNLTAEDKYRTVRRTELGREGGTQEEIDKQIDEQLSSMPAQEIVQIANKIDDDVKKMIAAEIEEIVGETEQAAEQSQAKEAEKVSKRRDSLKNFVQKQDNFLGLKLSEKAKSTIAKDIETGRFDEVVDLSDDEVRFAAYMFKRQGSKIGERFLKELAEKSREGYNKGIEKTTGKIHKTKTEGQGTRTGHQESSSGKKNFDNWGSMDL